MAVNIEIINWLFNRVGYHNDWRVLDVGESCVVHSTQDQLGEFIYNVGGNIFHSEESEKVIRSFSERSYQIGNPEVQTTFLSEVFEYSGLKYESIDVVIARKAQRIDLNLHTANDIMNGPFNILMNFGTTEHLINQYNAFKVFHDIVLPGGFMFHLVPLIGYLDHGYFSYKPLFFEDLARANDYEILEMWAFGPQGTQNFADIMGAHSMTNGLLPYNYVHNWQTSTTPIGALGTLFRKRHDAPFRVSLELKTSAALE